MLLRCGGPRASGAEASRCDVTVPNDFTEAEAKHVMSASRAPGSPGHPPASSIESSFLHWASKPFSLPLTFLLPGSVLLFYPPLDTYLP